MRGNPRRQRLAERGPTPPQLRRRAALPTSRGMRSHTLLLVPLLAGCAPGAMRPPSLAPRAAEAIDPRVPVPEAPVSMAVDPALQARLAALVAQAESGDLQFRGSAPAAERAASAAGARGSESWVAAQQALSALVAARGPVTRALADVDALAAATLARLGGISAGDKSAIETAAEAIARIDRGQAAVIERLQAILG